MNSFKLLLLGVLNNFLYPIIFILLRLYLEPDEIIQIFKIDALFVFFYNVMTAIAVSKFYAEDDKDCSGFGLSTLLSGIIPFIIYLIVNNIGVLLFGLWLVFTCYAEYAEEYAIKYNKNVLFVNIVSSIATILVVYIGFTYFNTTILSGWEKYYLYSLVGYFFFDFILKRLLWGIPIRETIIIKPFRLEWYRTELLGIKKAFLTDGTHFLSTFVSMIAKVARADMTLNPVVLSTFLLADSNSSSIFFSKDHLLKQVRNNIVEDDNPRYTRGTKISFLLLGLATIVVILIMGYGIMPFSLILLHIFVRLYIYTLALYKRPYYETKLKMIQKDYIITIAFTIGLGIKYIFSYTNSLYLLLVGYLICDTLIYLIVQKKYNKIYNGGKTHDSISR